MTSMGDFFWSKDNVSYCLFCNKPKTGSDMDFKYHLAKRHGKDMGPCYGNVPITCIVQFENEIQKSQESELSDSAWAILESQLLSESDKTYEGTGSGSNPVVVDNAGVSEAANMLPLEPSLKRARTEIPSSQIQSGGLVDDIESVITTIKEEMTSKIQEMKADFIHKIDKMQLELDESMEKLKNEMKKKR